jgi:hypothetical protein
MANDGIACVPGILRLTLYDADGSLNVSGCLDPGYPKTSGIRQCLLPFPPGVSWSPGRMRLKAELEYKGVRYPVPFACAQKLNSDGSLTIDKNL